MNCLKSLIRIYLFWVNEKRGELGENWIQPYNVIYALLIVYIFEFAIKEFDIIINTIKIRINSDDAWHCLADA